MLTKNPPNTYISVLYIEKVHLQICKKPSPGVKEEERISEFLEGGE